MGPILVRPILDWKPVSCAD